MARDLDQLDGFAPLGGSPAVVAAVPAVASVRRVEHRSDLPVHKPRAELGAVDGDLFGLLVATKHLVDVDLRHLAHLAAHALL